VKPVLKAAASIAAALALAFAIRYLYLLVFPGGGIAVGSLYEDRLVCARDMFLEKSTDFQAAAEALASAPGRDILRSADGKLLEISEDAPPSPPFPDDETAARALEALEAPFENGGCVFNIHASDSAVLFYTFYYDGGCAGIARLLSDEPPEGFEYLDLAENWKLFFDMSDK
jgi:hypothetical protein